MEKIANDGATILQTMDIQHPAAKMIVEVAKTHEVGDGTTTAAVLAGEFLKNAEELLEQGVHPTVIASGYRLASVKAKEILKTLAKPVTFEDKDLLLKNGKYTADVEDIKVEKKVGGSVEASELIEGMVIDKERVHINMPKNVHNARILLLTEALEIKKTEVKSEISIKTPDQLQLFLDQEEQMLHDICYRVPQSQGSLHYSSRGDQACCG
jgi:chaperonin GroEL (HSP60 family)